MLVGALECGFLLCPSERSKFCSNLELEAHASNSSVRLKDEQSKFFTPASPPDRAPLVVDSANETSPQFSVRYSLVYSPGWNPTCAARWENSHFAWDRVEIRRSTTRTSPDAGQPITTLHLNWTSSLAVTVCIKEQAFFISTVIIWRRHNSETVSLARLVVSSQKLTSLDSWCSIVQTRSRGVVEPDLRCYCPKIWNRVLLRVCSSAELTLQLYDDSCCGRVSNGSLKSGRSVTESG